MRQKVERQNEEFLRLFCQAKLPLERFCRAISTDRDSAAELAAEVVARAYERFDSLRKKEAFTAFLFTIASRVSMERRRKARIFVSLLPTTEQSDHGRQTELTESAIDAEYLYSLLGRLPNTQRETVILFEISGLSLEEIRAIQGGTLSGVKSRLVRGRACLVEMFRSDESSLIEKSRPANSPQPNSPPADLSSTVFISPIPERLSFDKQA